MTLSPARNPDSVPVVSGLASLSPNVLLAGIGVTEATNGAITKLAMLYVML